MNKEHIQRLREISFLLQGFSIGSGDETFYQAAWELDAIASEAEFELDRQTTEEVKR